MTHSQAVGSMVVRAHKAGKPCEFAADRLQLSGHMGGEVVSRAPELADAAIPGGFCTLPFERYSPECWGLSNSPVPCPPLWPIQPPRQRRALPNGKRSMQRAWQACRPGPRAKSPMLRSCLRPLPGLGSCQGRWAAQYPRGIRPVSGQYPAACGQGQVTRPPTTCRAGPLCTDFECSVPLGMWSQDLCDSWAPAWDSTGSAWWCWIITLTPNFCRSEGGVLWAGVHGSGNAQPLGPAVGDTAGYSPDTAVTAQYPGSIRAVYDGFRPVSRRCHAWAMAPGPQPHAGQGLGAKVLMLQSPLAAGFRT